MNDNRFNEALKISDAWHRLILDTVREVPALGLLAVTTLSGRLMTDAMSFMRIRGDNEDKIKELFIGMLEACFNDSKNVANDFNKKHGDIVDKILSKEIHE